MQKTPPPTLPPSTGGGEKGGTCDCPTSESPKTGRLEDWHFGADNQTEYASADCANAWRTGLSAGGGARRGAAGRRKAAGTADGDGLCRGGCPEQHGSAQRFRAGPRPDR